MDKFPVNIFDGSFVPTINGSSLGTVDNHSTHLVLTNSHLPTLNSLYPKYSLKEQLFYLMYFGVPYLNHYKHFHFTINKGKN